MIKNRNLQELYEKILRIKGLLESCDFWANLFTINHTKFEASLIFDLLPVQLEIIEGAQNHKHKALEELKELEQEIIDSIDGFTADKISEYFSIKYENDGWTKTFLSLELTFKITDKLSTYNFGYSSHISKCIVLMIATYPKEFSKICNKYSSHKDFWNNAFKQNIQILKIIITEEVLNSLDEKNQKKIAQNIQKLSKENIEILTQDKIIEKFFDKYIQNQELEAIEINSAIQKELEESYGQYSVKINKTKAFIPEAFKCLKSEDNKAAQHLSDQESLDSPILYSLFNKIYLTPDSQNTRISDLLYDHMKLLTRTNHYVAKILDLEKINKGNFYITKYKFDNYCEAIYDIDNKDIYIVFAQAFNQKETLESSVKRVAATLMHESLHKYYDIKYQNQCLPYWQNQNAGTIINKFKECYFKYQNYVENHKAEVVDDKKSWPIKLHHGLTITYGKILNVENNVFKDDKYAHRELINYWITDSILKKLDYNIFAGGKDLEELNNYMHDYMCIELGGKLILFQ